MSSISNSPSAIQESLDEMKKLLASKNSDYKIDDEFSNFIFAAELADVTTTEVMLVQIGIKLGRLKGAEGNYYNNESAADTVRDLAGYANILNAYINHRERNAHSRRTLRELFRQIRWSK